MDESTQNIDLAKAQKTAAELIAATFRSGATEAFLSAQAGLLKGAETVITEWLRRRKEAIEDAHRLVACERAVISAISGSRSRNGPLERCGAWLPT